MHEAFEPFGDQVTYRFRKFAALVRRLGGDDWQLEHESQHWPPLETRTVMVLRRDRRLRVPASALTT
jgi:hypothetical protein